MKQLDALYAKEKLALLKSQFMVDIFQDWGDTSGTWQDGFWSVT